MKRGLKRFGIGLAIFFALSAIIYFGFLESNIHVVIPRKIYRSAELSPTEFRQVVHRYHIKTILNLRGSDPSARWYQQEIKVSKQLGVAHVDLALASKMPPTIPELHQLVHLLLTLPEPILIHCKKGADRTGLASAISLVLMTHDNLKQVANQYSFKYLVVAPSSVGKLVMPLYYCWLKRNALPTSKANFFQWLKQLKAGQTYPLPHHQYLASYLTHCHHD